MKIGFIGLGSMGTGMAHCINSDHSLVVYNRSPEKALDLVSKGAVLASSPDELTDCDVLCSMLSNDVAVESVFLSGGSLKLRLRGGTIHLSHSTISPDLVDRLSQAHRDAGVEFLSAPVLGRPDKAATGKLYTIVAGTRSSMKRCESVLNAISVNSYWVGEDPRMAAIAKIGINFLVASALESLAESFAMIRLAGIDPEAFLPLVTNTIFDAQAYHAYAPLVARELNPEPGFKTTLGLKDVNLAINESRKIGAELPIAELVSERLSAAIEAGFADDDWSSLARLAARQAKLPPIT